MDVGWSDLGGWTALLDGDRRRWHAAGSSRPARRSRLGADDLLIRGSGPTLRITAGPSGTIRTDGPDALLTGAARHRRRIEELLGRVAEREAESP